MSVVTELLRDVTDISDVSRYDLLLAVLPLPLACGTLVATLVGAPTALGVGIGGIPSMLLLAYGLFFDAPAPEPDRREGAAGRPSSPESRGSSGRRRSNGRGRFGA